jgi:hypothetical protein
MRGCTARPAPRARCTAPARAPCSNRTRSAPTSTWCSRPAARERRLVARALRDLLA